MATNIVETCFSCPKIKDLKSCSRCKLVKYCSINCQKKEFDEHNYHCKQIQKQRAIVEVFAEELRNGKFQSKCITVGKLVQSEGEFLVINLWVGRELGLR